MVILIHALDNIRPGSDYPSNKKIPETQYYSVLSEKTLERAAELRAQAEAGEESRKLWERTMPLLPVKEPRTYHLHQEEKAAQRGFFPLPDAIVKI
ncbi:hypothetical protein F4814DRAFT_446529 [Daldinia grandis]|nr:hypothetical protein F4814DRAFT_446529 [Daldinia grandis]